MTRALPFAVLGLLACGAIATAQPAGTTGSQTDAKPKTAEAPKTATAPKTAEAEAPAADEARTQEERDDAVLDRAQPDFTIINLPTTLRLPQWKSAFRVSHRFTRALGDGSFGSLVEDFFGMDAGALIGLEFRFGILPGTQVGVLRTNDRTIQFFGQYDVKSQSKTFPVGLAAYAAVDGTNNFRNSYSPAIGVIVSRTIDERVAIYAHPIYVNNSNEHPSEVVEHNSTMLLGLGARVRVRPSVYVVGEFVPRVAGHDPGVHAANVGIEKRAGGHSFQLNFSNSFGATIGQIARGGISNEDWYLGFNISRKFF